MNKPSIKENRAIAALIVYVGLLTACSTTAPGKGQIEIAAPVQTVAVSVSAPDVYYTVERGDQLAEIAESVTGDVNNWPAIAEANGISDPRKMRVGQQLFVPGHLLPSVMRDEVAPTNHDIANSIPTAVAMRSIERKSIPTEATLDTGSVSGLEEAEVVVTTANPNKRFVLTPLGEGANSEEATKLTGSEYIKIIGSYFPKVVYRSPELDAKQLMRVAPGSTFPLEKLDNGWYRISTDKGIGYLRTVDGEPTSSNG